MSEYPKPVFNGRGDFLVVKDGEEKYFSGKNAYIKATKWMKQ